MCAVRLPRVERGSVERWAAVFVMALAGGLVALQPALNSGLGRAVGGLPAAMLSFVIGALVLAGIVVLTGQTTRVAAADEVPWYYLLGGLIGALWVALSIPAVKAVGAGGVVAATIAGQLTGAVVADRLGVLGLEQVGITPARLTGVALLALGTYLIVR
jgi:bacterial/archaeal transporter family-2 protein